VLHGLVCSLRGRLSGSGLLHIRLNRRDSVRLGIFVAGDAALWNIR
jgi:hypothetical protein